MRMCVFIGVFVCACVCVACIMWGCYPAIISHHADAVATSIDHSHKGHD
jgi:hypothetical protein